MPANEASIGGLGHALREVERILLFTDVPDNNAMHHRNMILHALEPDDESVVAINKARCALEDMDRMLDDQPSNQGSTASVRNETARRNSKSSALVERNAFHRAMQQVHVEVGGALKELERKVFITDLDMDAVSVQQAKGKSATALVAKEMLRDINEMTRVLCFTDYEELVQAELARRAARRTYTEPVVHVRKDDRNEKNAARVLPEPDKRSGFCHVTIKSQRSNPNPIEHVVQRTKDRSSDRSGTTKDPLVGSEIQILPPKSVQSTKKEIVDEDDRSEEDLSAWLRRKGSKYYKQGEMTYTSTVAKERDTGFVKAAVKAREGAQNGNRKLV